MKIKLDVKSKIKIVSLELSLERCSVSGSTDVSRQWVPCSWTRDGEHAVTQFCPSCGDDIAQCYLCKLVRMQVRRGTIKSEVCGITGNRLYTGRTVTQPTASKRCKVFMSASRLIMAAPPPPAIMFTAVVSIFFFRRLNDKGQVLDVALLHDEHMPTSALQSRKWQLIGMS